MKGDYQLKKVTVRVTSRRRMEIFGIASREGISY